jgi:hypothetical protein
MNQIQTPTKYAEQLSTNLEKIFAMHKQVLQMSFDAYEKTLESRYAHLNQTCKLMTEAAERWQQQMHEQQTRMRTPMHTTMEKYFPASTKQWNGMEQQLTQHYQTLREQLETSHSAMDNALERGQMLERKATKVVHAYAASQLSTLQDTLQGMVKRQPLLTGVSARNAKTEIKAPVVKADAPKSEPAKAAAPTPKQEPATPASPAPKVEPAKLTQTEESKKAEPTKTADAGGSKPEAAAPAPAKPAVAEAKPAQETSKGEAPKPEAKPTPSRRNNAANKAAVAVKEGEA